MTMTSMSTHHQHNSNQIVSDAHVSTRCPITSTFVKRKQKLIDQNSEFLSYQEFSSLLQHQQQINGEEEGEENQRSRPPTLIESIYQMLNSPAVVKICTCTVFTTLLLCISIIVQGINGTDVIDVIVVEAEDAVLYSDVKVKDQHTGFSGTGYLDFQKQYGFVEWEVEVHQNAVYDIVLRYASVVDRPCDLFIGDTIEIGYDFARTGSWNIWSTEVHSAYLQKGFHIFHLSASRSTGPNIDTLMLFEFDPNIDWSSDLPDSFTQNYTSPAAADDDGTDNPATAIPSATPTDMPSSFPTKTPSRVPSSSPSYVPTTIPSYKPSTTPSVLPSLYPSSGPSDKPSIDPTNFPSSLPSFIPTFAPSTSPSHLPTMHPSSSPTRVPSAEPTGSGGFQSAGHPGPPPGQSDQGDDNNQGQDPPTNGNVVPAPPVIDYAKTIILETKSGFAAGIFKSSPNGIFQFGLDDTGDLVLLEEGNMIWNANVKGGSKLHLQVDGNLVVRHSNSTTIWSTNTHGLDDSKLVLDDGGRVAVSMNGTASWLAGKPRAEYKGPSSADLQFPTRGAFYYAWYKETWTVNGVLAHAKPTLSYYRSDDPYVVEKHIEALEYAHVDLGIISWWGPGATLEAARLTLLMDKTREMKSNLKWTIYYEDENAFDYTPETIKSDLDYVKAHYAWQPTFAHVNGKPLVFVYNEAGCEVVTRWNEANKDGEWYVVLKLFPKYFDCEDQPDSWHEYGPANAFVNHPPYSSAVSPGFWRADKAVPRLARVELDDFYANVVKMVDNGNDWQLLTTFNEHGEGTALESCEGWESESGYGHYMDILHEIY